MLAALTQVRLIWLRGLYGTGKTLLSVALCYELIRRGWVGRVFSPFPTSFPLSESHSGILLLDEAGTVFGNRSFADKELAASVLQAVSFLRKSNSYLFFPSYTKPDIMFRRGIHIERIRAPLGRLAWLYRWWLPLDEETEDDYRFAKWKGIYPLFFPARLFGAYDTKFVPSQRDIKVSISKFNQWTVG